MTRTLLFFLLIASLPGQTPSLVKNLKFPTLRQVKIPDVAMSTLPNGMQLMLLENHELPLVRGLALVRTGNLFDPADKVGLAGMTGAVLRTGGTKTKPGDRIDEQLENIAASVESGIGESYGTISFSALKQNTDEVMGVFKDLLTAPEFREDKVELEKNQLRSSISRRNDEPSGIASREFAGIVYGKDNSYGWDMQYSHVDRIQRADLVAFYQRYFFPANIIVAVQGDFNSAEMRVKVEKLFADWTVQQPKVPEFPPVKKQTSASGAFIATKNDVTQTTFILGQLGGVLNEKDYPALEVMADILGGGFRSRLFQTVRTKLGYAYNISANWGATYDHPGLFQISGSTKSASTTDSIKVVEEEVRKLRTTEVTDDELATAKQSVLNSFVFNFDTPSKTLNRLLIYQYFHYPKDFLFQYQKAVAAVTRADILRVAKERLDPKTFTLVAVGKPKDFSQPLSSLGMPVKELDISIPEPKAEAVQGDSASLAKGKQLLEQVQKAVGGADKLAAVKDFSQHVEMQIDPAVGGMKADQQNQLILPATFRQDSVLPFGKISVFSSGETGWLVTPQGAVALPAAQQKQISGELFRVYPVLLLSDRLPDRTVNLVGDGTLEISDKAGNSVRLFVDPKTMLPMKEQYQQVQPGGPPAAIEQVFGNFRAVNGIQVPQSSTVMQNGHKFADVKILETKVNQGLKPELLSKKP